MNGEYYPSPSEGMTVAVLAEDELYLGTQFEFVSSDLTDENYNTGLKSKLESLNKELMERFNNLAETWENETVNLSSAQEIILHPAYQRIIGMGPGVIPLILKRLQKTPNFWFWALRALTDVEPVRESERGFLSAMKEAWLRWGEENGYL